MSADTSDRTAGEPDGAEPTPEGGGRVVWTSRRTPDPAARTDVPPAPHAVLTRSAPSAARYGKRWVVLVPVVLAAAALGLIISAQRAPAYSATAIILLQDPSVNALGGGGLRADEAERWISSRAQVATFDGTLARAARTLGNGVRAETLLEAVSAEPDIENFTLSITARAGAPQEAADRANAVVGAYRDVENDAAADAATAVEGSYRGRLESITASIEQASATLSGDPTNRLATTLLTASVNERLRLESAAAERAADARRGALSIRDLTPAAVPASQSSPPPYQNAMVTGLLALLAGVAVLLHRGRERRGTMSTADQASGVLGGPLLADVMADDLRRPETSPSTTSALQFAVAILQVRLGDTGGVVLMTGLDERATTRTATEQVASLARQSSARPVLGGIRSSPSSDTQGGAGSANVVLVAGPPLRRSGDAASQVLETDGVVLVVHEGDEEARLRSAADVLTLLNARLLGYVFIRRSEAAPDVSPA